VRRTIHGRRFDTESSTLIGGCDATSDGSTGWIASLYVTPRSRRFFLAGRGGFMSRFRGEETIVELTKEEATAWIEEYLGAEALDWGTKEKDHA
jgi:hypothetical protein